MSLTVPNIDDHYQAVLVALGDLPFPVERGVKPTGAGWQGVPGASSFVPYAIVDPIPGGVTSGPAGDPQGDASVPFDVRCVGASATQAQQVADRVMIRLCSSIRALDIPGRRMSKPINIEMAGTARPDMSMGDDQTLFISAPRFRMSTTPEGSGS